MKKIKGLFPKIYDFENLFYSYKAAIKCKRYRQDVMEYTDRLEDNLIILQNELIWGLYEVGRYNIFYVYEPKKRLIMSLLFKDRVAQHAIYRQLNPLIEKRFIYDSYACRVGKGTHKAIDRLQYWLCQTERKPERYYYLKLDVSKYFYRIDHQKLKEILAKMIDDPPLLELLAKIIDCEDTKFGLPLGADIGDVAFDEMLGDVGLPIGNLTSQMFANLYLNELDQFCKHKLKLHYYIRYMDDIIILHHDKKYLEKVKQEIAAFLGSELHLQLNKKTCIRPASMGIEFVGFRVWSTHRKLRKKTAKKLKRRLQYMFHAYTIGEIDKETLDRSVASYRGILKHFDSYGLRKSLNEMYIKEVHRENDISGNSGIMQNGAGMAGSGGDSDRHNTGNQISANALSDTADRELDKS
ncbi:reverse transcriptase/maturase family protein [Mediterraneibacter gnavus]|uniref:reverse transcriptase/maturase family protein n=1 Tax=Mediterraneibacter gnavus TaxID=33038 RepID=UPI0035653C69